MQIGDQRTYPSPYSNSFRINIGFPGPSPVRKIAGLSTKGNKIAKKGLLGSIDLIDRLEKSKISLDSIPQVPTLVPGTSPINSNNDVLVFTGKVMVPIPTEGEVNCLTCWTTVTVS